MSSSPVATVSAAAVAVAVGPSPAGETIARVDRRAEEGLRRKDGGRAAGGARAAWRISASVGLRASCFSNHALAGWVAEQQGKSESKKPLTIWLDKACIVSAAASAKSDGVNRLSELSIGRRAVLDRSVEAAVRALPVYLSFTKSLVILAGGTYTSRLWCLVECFTFLQMGATMGRIHIAPAGASVDELRRLFGAISIADAQCYQADQAIVLVAFSRMKFWLSIFAQHAAPPHPGLDHQSSDAHSRLRSPPVICAGGTLSVSAEQG